MIFLMSALAAQGKEAVMYDYKDFKLGMSLSDFKATKEHPTTDQGASYPKCTNDTFDDSAYQDTSNLDEDQIWQLSELDKRAGLVNCHWVYDNVYTIGKWKQLSRRKVEIPAGDGHTGSYVFRFIKGPRDSEPRLFSIAIGFRTRDFDSVTLALQKKFGKGKLGGSIVGNAMGAKFSNGVFSWNNSLGSVTVQKHFKELGNSLVEYKLKEHYSFWNRSIANLEAKEPSKM